jgi:putative ABC transport system ATP-binding protein
VISLRQVTKSYITPAGTFTALKAISLEVADGQFAAVVGKSGSGKSTLLNMAGGIDRPSSGEVIVNGTSIERLSEHHLAPWRGRSIGFVFQFFQLLPTLTAIENVMLPMDFSKKFPVIERRDRARRLLGEVGVADQADKLPATLSGGQQQRVAIARALANEPRVLLADEPTGNLDSHTAASILELLSSIAAKGSTVLIATHERNVAGLDRVIEIVDGEVLNHA